MLPTSSQFRLALIEMNALPCINFISSMIPLAPPDGYWNKLHSTISTFFVEQSANIRIKASTLQSHKSSGGVGINLPNFYWYSWHTH